MLSIRRSLRRCNITLEVNHLTEGIKLGLQDDREKNSDALGRLALFKVGRALRAQITDPKRLHCCPD